MWRQALLQEKKCNKINSPLENPIMQIEILWTAALPLDSTPTAGHQSFVSASYSCDNRLRVMTLPLVITGSPHGIWFPPMEP